MNLPAVYKNNHGWIFHVRLSLNAGMSFNSREDCRRAVVPRFSQPDVLRLRRCYEILKPDCPFIGALFAEDSLFELRCSLQLAEVGTSLLFVITV